ncbi:hypothetical protein NC653_004962 [Populus alba x Populus x berolinensis]|uniref:Uncharacterized protein n=1 Tax=Populus alba x Populus x berolinensis TaxID=444605 RepID=A0AAD6RAW5_9ROSI|nr:hypothetical protein NC653_004962 [Populus alba x Populus x berolinensis]
MDHDNSRVPMSKSEHGARNSDRPLASGVRMSMKCETNEEFLFNSLLCEGGFFVIEATEKESLPVYKNNYFSYHAVVDLRKSLRIDMALQIDLIAWDMKGKGREELFRPKEKMRANKEVLEYVLHH